MERSSSTGRLVVRSIVTFYLLSTVSCSQPNKSKERCICPEEMLNFTIRRVFCGAELLSDSCEKNTIYTCEVGNNKTHMAMMGLECWKRWRTEAWCGLRCSNRWSYSCNPRCMDIERADQSYRKIYKHDLGTQPDYTPWGSNTPHIWIL